ncbi:MAG TPA: hypothetical protein PLH57_01615 [Oligoflexia bacterium]|nr:hypothetical protein [Oligoflexia bacterium]
MALIPARATASGSKSEVKSEVDFNWTEVEGATHYVVTIAKDPTFQKVITNIDTAYTKARSQPLPPGAYYWTVDAFNDLYHLHRLAPRPIVVGSPYQITGESLVKLPAPQTLSPPDQALYPPLAKIRLAWAQVPGAKKYLFRLWDEDHRVYHTQIKKESHLRWETTVDRTWIVVHDAPYSSFIYLDPGDYRWEVAGVNEDNHQMGEFASGRFEVNKKYFFKPRVHELSLFGITSPRYFVRFGSLGSNANIKVMTIPFGGGGAWNWWGSRVSGLRLTASVVSVIRRHTMRKIALEGRFRYKLSNVPKAWHFEFGIGPSFLQLPHIDVNSITRDETVDLLSTLGPLAELALVYQFESPYTNTLGFRTGLPMLLIRGQGEGGRIVRGVDMRVFNELRWHTSANGFLSGSLELFYSEVQFRPNGVSEGRSIARYIGPSIRLGLGLVF